MSPDMTDGAVPDIERVPLRDIRAWGDR